MLHRDFSTLSADQLRAHASQLERSERDIRQRAEIRVERQVPHVTGQRDLVLERLIWLLARVGARRRTLAARVPA